MLPAIISTFGLAFFYFIAAIPAGAALQLPLPVAAVTAGLSYAAGVLAVVLIGAPLRERLTKRFNISTTHDPNKLIWRVWDKYGLIGLSLLAPVTLGAQIGALIGLSLGVKPRALVIGLSLGIIPWCVVISAAVALGLQVVRPA
ncbi:MAG: small multi-drug export protein [Chloroflexi bacterium]|nr:small multi-drug export protein [Chloroflexota bacterium]MCC6897263.1 small multi-drug export protein [Anaerolineae bacterium]